MVGVWDCAFFFFFFSFSSFLVPSLMLYGGLMRRVRVGVKVHNGEVEVTNRFL